VSRGVSPDVSVKSATWKSGPPFLKDNPQYRPDLNKSEVFALDSNVFNKRPPSAQVYSVVECEDAFSKLLLYVSDLYKLEVAVAWLRRFVLFICQRRQSHFVLEKSPISVEELADAKKLLVRHVQRQNLSLWFIKATGKTNLRVLSQSSPVKRLDPILVDGIRRVGGRLEKAPLSYEARHPVILPQVLNLTDLIIRQCHVNAAHSGANHTLTVVCQRYWILKAFVAVRRAIKDCPQCRRRNAKPAQQIMAESTP